MANEIPVYLFVGFLESGKTKFIQETFEDPNFDSGDKTLLLVCEEGEEEYNEKKFAFPGVTLKVLEDKAELNPQNLARLEKESGAGRVVIEYNGMWLLQDLADALPENWLVYQCIATADGTTALTYARDNSMRSLMLDKIARSELIVFNRAEAVNNDDARQELHKLVRQASRKCDIAYEFKDGSVAYDDIPDPLPFDINADPIDIPDDDFGIWYMDCQDEPQKYTGKTVRFLAQVCQTNRAGKNSFVPGAAGEILVCKNGAGVEFSEEDAKRILSEKEIEILVDLCGGEASSTAWGCDLTYDYVKINGDYRT